MKMRPSQKKSYSSKRIQLPVIVPASSLVIIIFILLIGFDQTPLFSPFLEFIS